MNEESIVLGRNSAIEVLKAKKRSIEKVLISDKELKGSITKVIGIARDNNIKVEYVNSHKLDKLANGEVHQGVIVIVSPYVYREVEDIFRLAEERKEDPFILILDGLEDVQNFGAIIRTAEASGVHGIIIPKRRSATVNSTVVKTSSGAVEYMNIVKVTNISSTIEMLKEKGIWIYGADMGGEEYFKTNLTGPVAIITGNEGKGISRLVREKCDGLIKIPMNGKISSLNASVATSVLVYEVVRQRLKG